MQQRDIICTIASGQSVSDTLDLRKGNISIIQVPAITSGDLLFQGAMVDSGANSFSRIREYRSISSGDLRMATGAGSCMLVLSRTFRMPSYGRLETSVAQAAPVQFVVRFSSS